MRAISTENRIPNPGNALNSGSMPTINVDKKSRNAVGSDLPLKSKTGYIGEYLSFDRMTLNYTGKDGDSFSFDYQKLQLQRVSAGENETVKEDERDFSKMLNELYDTLQSKIIEKLSESLGISIKKNENIDDKSMEVTDGGTIEGLPEYWNAENTAQRIFDFSVSFFSVSSQDAEGYYVMMKEAITKGYDEAIGEIGSVSKEVSALSERTLELALEKLDEWARNNGVDVEKINEAANDIAA